MTGSASFLEAWLAGARSVAYARFTADGILTGANARFLEIVEGRLETAPLPELVIEGQRDEMVRILHGGELPGEPSFVHFAVEEQTPTTLVVTWMRDRGELVLLGESPVADMETTEALLEKLNRRVSDLARENVKKSARLDALNRELEEAYRLAHPAARRGHEGAGGLRLLRGPRRADAAARHRRVQRHGALRRR